VARGGERTSVLAKIGRDADAALMAREAILPIAAERLKRSSVVVPELLESKATPSTHVIVQSLVEDGKPVGTNWSLDLLVQVAVALAEADLSHGDLTPWNILTTPRGPALVDWEFSSERHVPARDLTHFLVQTAILDGRRNRDHLLMMLLGNGGPGMRYAQAVGLSKAAFTDAVVTALIEPGDASVTSELATGFRSELVQYINRHG
jgi:hypothetical protein